ncbi:glycosyltransferase family 2 protein [Kiloniella laminariae]|uniref:glycosyltransferase family 2 protein n=1 Tax=Kiloniella laminariae TaxID=454162 RepID=UPI000373DE0B|nr:glycosyltransferase family 2 protein [Kiloniella laminariae]
MTEVQVVLDNKKIFLSALLVVHNEEKRIRDCLERVKFCDEIVVVLDRCTDGTKDIVLEYTDCLLEGGWPIEGDRRNAGNAACRGEWVLEIDADEHISPELAQEIRATVERAEADYYLIPVDNYIGSHLVRYGWGAQFGKSSASCLCRKGIKRWGRDRVHPSLYWKDGAKKGDKLKTRLLHYVDNNISDMIRRFDSYTTARAKDLIESGTIGTMRGNVRRIFSRFWRCYIRRKGYREGGYGFLIATFAALYPVVSHIKARYEAEQLLPDYKVK